MLALQLKDTKQRTDSSLPPRGSDPLHVEEQREESIKLLPVVGSGLRTSRQEEKRTWSEEAAGADPRRITKYRTIQQQSERGRIDKAREGQRGR